MMNIHLIIFWLFVLTSISYLFINRSKFEREGIIFIMKRKEGINLMEKTSKKYKNFLKWYGKFSFVIAVIFMIFVSIWLIQSAISSFKGHAGLSLVLPSATGSFSTKPGLIFIPLWLWLITIVIIAIPHEFAHGVVAISENMKIKSAGLAFLLFIPGAFVEPDEKHLRGAKRIKMASAGPSTNIILGSILLLTSYLLIQISFYPNGVDFQGLINGSDAASKNLSGTILSVNNQEIRKLSDLKEFLEKTNATTFDVITTTGRFKIEAYYENGRKMIGISGVTTHLDERFSFSQTISKISLYLFWIGMLSVGVGLANLIPTYPFDGGHIIDEVVKNRKLKRFIMLSSGILLGINILVPILLALL